MIYKVAGPYQGFNFCAFVGVSHYFLEELRKRLPTAEDNHNLLPDLLSDTTACFLCWLPHSFEFMASERTGGAHSKQGMNFGNDLGGDRAAPMLHVRLLPEWVGDGGLSTVMLPRNCLGSVHGARKLQFLQGICLSMAVLPD